MSLDVIVVMTTRSESESDVTEALGTLARATTQEPGCMSYAAHKSTSEPHTYLTVERWLDRQAFDKHMGTPHVAAAGAALEGHLAGPPAIHLLSGLV